MNNKAGKIKGITRSKGASQAKRLATFLGESGVFTVALLSSLAVLFIIFFIALDAIPFFSMRGFKEFFFSTKWYPAGEPPEFGSFAIIYGSFLVTLVASVIAVPMALLSSVCLSDILPFSLRQFFKPVVEIIAAIPSVAYGFFALVILAPLMQNWGGGLLAVMALFFTIPITIICFFLIKEFLKTKFDKNNKLLSNIILFAVIATIILSNYLIYLYLNSIKIKSGTNILNVSLILAVMALPTIVSVSEDALQAVGRDLREGSYALGATRTETLVKVVLPAARSGIIAAVILGIMRALGETMVVWMASGNSASLPEPWYNLLAPIRTLTATIAGDMGEADHVTGSARYHVLFAMALFLLISSFIGNFISEYYVKKSKQKLGG